LFTNLVAEALDEFFIRTSAPLGLANQARWRGDAMQPQFLLTTVVNAIYMVMEGSTRLMETWRVSKRVARAGVIAIAVDDVDKWGTRFVAAPQGSHWRSLSTHQFFGVFPSLIPTVNHGTLTMVRFHP